MGKTKRSVRIAGITKILMDNPNRAFPLKEFAGQFLAAKSSISEDLTMISEAVEACDTGRITTYTGAAGGVKYIPRIDKQAIDNYLQSLTKVLSDSRRALPGGYIYMADILYDPVHLSKMAEIIASRYVDSKIDKVVTIETKGIPIALMTARALGVPLVVARRENRINEGPFVTINYISASSQNMQTLSLPRKAIQSGQKVLIVDDFMKGGGSAKGLQDLMKEFNVTVNGIAVVMVTKRPENKMVDEYISLLKLELVDAYQGHIVITPSEL